MADFGLVGAAAGTQAGAAPVNAINTDRGQVGSGPGTNAGGGATNSGALRTSAIAGTVSTASIVGTVTQPASITGTVR